MRVEGEVEGDIRAIEARLELEAAGVPVPLSAVTLEDHYTEAYEAAVTSAKVEERDVTEIGLQAQAREAGKRAIIEGYLNGLVATSTNLETYPSMFGEHWDQMNQAAQSGN